MNKRCSCDNLHTFSATFTNLGGEPMVEGGGVGLLPALCLLRMAWVLLTLLTDSFLSPSSGTKAGKTSVVYITVSIFKKKDLIKKGNKY